MLNTNSFPHAGYYYFDDERSIEYRSEVSSRLDFERLIHGRPAFAHNIGLQKKQAKVLIVNDWRIFVIHDKESSYRIDQIYQTLYELASRGSEPFCIYLQSHTGFTPFSVDMSLSEFIEIAKTQSLLMTEGLQKNDMIKTKFLTFHQETEETENLTEERVFVIDQIEMDALIRQSAEVRHEVSLEDLAEFNDTSFNLDNNDFNFICDQVEHFTTHTLIYNLDDTHSSYSSYGALHAYDQALLPRAHKKAKTAFCTHALYLDMQKIKAQQPQKDIKTVAPYALIICDKEQDKSQELTSRHDHSWLQAIADHVHQLQIEVNNPSTLEEITTYLKLAHLCKINLLISKSTLTEEFETKFEVSAQKLTESILNYSFEKLTHFSVYNDYIDISNHYTRHFIQNSPNLRYLFLSAGNWGDISYIQALHANVSIKYFKVDSPIGMTQVLDTFLQAMPNLECLEIHEWRVPLGDDSFDFSLLKLIKLSVSSIVAVSASFFHQISKGSTAIKFLRCIQNKSTQEFLQEDADYVTYEDEDSESEYNDYQYEILAFDRINYKALEKLELIDFKFSSDRIMKIVHGAASTLYSLDLSKTQVIRDNLAPRTPINTKLIHINYGDADSLCPLVSLLACSHELRLLSIKNAGDPRLRYSSTISEALSRLQHLEILELADKQTLTRDQIKMALKLGTLTNIIQKDRENHEAVLDHGVDLERALIDASYDKTRPSNYNITRHFFHSSGEHPHVSLYREKIYDTLEINPEACSQNEAFTLKHSSDDLELVDVDNIQIVAHVAKNIPDDDAVYTYCLGTKVFFASERWQAIPSLSATETLTHCCGSSSHQYQIKYSKRDDLYYIKIDNDPNGLGFKFEFIIQRPIQHYTMPVLNNFSEQLRAYKNVPLTLAEQNHYTGSDLYREMVNQKKGACRHRAIVFKKEVDDFFQKNFPQNNPYIVRVIANTCHMFCEVATQNEPSKVVSFQLGGAPGSIHLNEALNPLNTLCDLKDEALLHDDVPFNISKIAQDDVKAVKKSLENKLSENHTRCEAKQKINQLIEGLCYEKPELLATIGAQISQEPHKKILIKTNTEKQSFDAVLHLIKHFSENNPDYFIILHPEELLTPTHHIATEQKSDIGHICNEPGGKLYDFLTRHRNVDEHATLIVLYDRFKPRALIQFNKMIEEKGQKVDQVDLQEQINIIGVYNVASSLAYTGADFYSRFDKKILLASNASSKQNLPMLIPPTMLSTSKVPTVFRVDFYYDSLWSEYLFGHWQMTSDSLNFTQSAFIKQLKNNPNTVFEFYNCPLDHELTYTIEKAKMLGFLMVNTTPIFFPENINIQFKAGYDFEPYLSKVRSQYASEIEPGKMELFNNDTLDHFIGSYMVDDQRKIQLKQGFLETNEGGFLSVFIHVEISEAVLLKFLKHMLKYNVFVHMYYREKTFLPAAFNTQYDAYLEQNPVTTYDGETKAPAAKKIKLHHDRDVHHEPVLILRGHDVDVTQFYYEKNYTCFDKDKTIILDVSEITSENLLQRIDANFNHNSNTYEFSVIDGILNDQPYHHYNFILKGTFSQDIINKLSKFLLEWTITRTDDDSRQFVLIPHNPELFDFFPVKNKEHVKLNDDDIIRLKTEMLAKNFSLDEAHIVDAIPRDNLLTPPYSILQAYVYYHLISIKSDPWQGVNQIEQQNISEQALDLSNSSEKTWAFYQARFDKIKAILKVDEVNPPAQSSYVFITGLTGVGKTHFVHHHWKKHFPHCYFGLDQMKAFCQNNENGIKTLVIDEANLLPQAFSVLEGLFETKPHVRVDKDVFFLTRQHKVMLIGNPLNYSKDRHLASFIAHHGNCCLFDELLPHVLFQEVFLPLFKFLNLSDKFHEPLAMYLLKRQNFINVSAGKIIMSPRELTAIVLLTLKPSIKFTYEILLLNAAEIAVNTVIKAVLTHELLQAYQHHFNPVIYDNMFNNFDEHQSQNNYLLTSSRKIVRQTVEDFISIALARKKLMEETQFTSTPIMNASFLYDGLNGILIEGMPGVGKTELVLELLQSFSKDVPFFHIEASSSLEDKQKQLLNAFHQGAIVLMDEINTACLEERFLNAILSGIDPYNHQRAHTPGFLLIGTMNPANIMSGRQTFGEALSRRFLQLNLPDYSTKEMIQILQHKGLKHDHAEYLVTKYLQKKLEQKQMVGQGLCFRDLIAISQKLLSSTVPCMTSSISAGLAFYGNAREKELPDRDCSLGNARI